MTLVAFTCPRCRFAGTRAADVRFCPRCGLPDVAAGEDQQPISIRLGDETVVVRDRLALGDICNLYRCEMRGDSRQSVLKIARTHVSNQHVLRESQTLNRLHKADGERRFAPFLPRSIGTLDYEAAANEPARVASVLSYHEGIKTPDELYALEEVRDAYPGGVDSRDMAWMWRRLLTILGFVHQTGIVHGSVTPDHVLIEPKEHKLVLVGWCGAVPAGSAPVLRQKYHFYFIIPGGAAHGRDRDILAFWQQHVGAHNVLNLADPNDTSESIAMTIGINEGVISMDQAQQHLTKRGKIGKAVDQIMSAIGGLFASGSPPPPTTTAGTRRL